ncbi:hypothetical protein [Enterococcus phage vB_EfaS_785CS]|uniref:Uncharacterized protein n=1 Tax=Enterococcus phage vB_EfaS_785CS TaxID=2836121 RepID=A0A8E6YJC7_9CAUD|nr:hypothetical protein [Enterococcus phage vB_EfaS_785CC]QVU02048.1 hypothetical protein [Enterococcus phage vB_EfaS_785CS]
MQYTWTEKGTCFKNNDYQFTMYKLVDYDAVVVRCTYGSYVTRLIFSPDEERFIYESLDEMKELLYNKSYI